MKTLIITLAIATSLIAAPNARTVTLTWTASASPEVTGYSVSRINGSQTTVLTATPLSAATLTFNDSAAVVGQTYTYQVVALAAPCTPTTPVTASCGQSAPATVATNIPQVPGATATVTVIVQ